MTQYTPGATQEQLPLFDDIESATQVVNVASVAQRSVFRYPGGKTWFVPYARRWLATQPAKPDLLIEPFAGGGIIGLTAIFENLVERLLLVELDERVASVWQTLLGPYAQWLAEKIVTFELNAGSVERELTSPKQFVHERAFQTILTNRVNRGGILAAGAGRIKDGENGKGLRSRWYPETLARRILDIAALKGRITFVHGDGMDVLRLCREQSRVVFFMDPPYTAGGKNAGRRLYTHHEVDHAALFDIANQLSGDFIFTYDESEEVRGLAQAHGFEINNIVMKNTHHRAQRELVISRKK